MVKVKGILSINTKDLQKLVKMYANFFLKSALVDFLGANLILEDSTRQMKKPT